MRRLAVRSSAVAVLLGAGAASGWAATIGGTSHADVIHGTPRADVIHGLGGNDTIYGGAGNDKLYGGAGNDLLVGGPGLDLLDCGTGHDTAIAGAGDRVVHCEVVKRLRPTQEPPPNTNPNPTPPPTTTATTTTATTTTTAGMTPQTGQYCGFTNNGGGLCFNINGPPYVFTNLTWSLTFDAHDCDPPSDGSVNYTTFGSAAVQTDGSFDFYLASGNAAGSDIKGVLDSTGGASGTMHIQTVFVESSGNITCQLNATWTAARQ
jgi:hypothetical protein